MIRHCDQNGVISAFFDRNQLGDRLDPLAGHVIVTEQQFSKPHAPESVGIFEKFFFEVSRFVDRKIHRSSCRPPG